MQINQLFMQLGQASATTQEGTGMQKGLSSAGYLFSDIIKVHLGGDSTKAAGLPNTEGGSETQQTDPLKNLLSLLSGLISGGADGSGILQTGSDAEKNAEIKFQTGETTITLDELEAMLAYLTQLGLVTNQPVDSGNQEFTTSDIQALLKNLEENKNILLVANTEQGKLTLEIKPEGVNEATNASNSEDSKAIKLVFTFEADVNDGKVVTETQVDKSQQKQSAISNQQALNGIVNEDEVISENTVLKKVVSDLNGKTQTSNPNSISEIPKNKEESESNLRLVEKSEAQKNATAEAKKLDSILKDLNPEKGKSTSDGKSGNTVKINLSQKSEEGSVKQTETKSQSFSEDLKTGLLKSKLSDSDNAKDLSGAEKQNGKEVKAQVKPEMAKSANDQTIAEKAVKADTAKVEAQNVLKKVSAQEAQKPTVEQSSVVKEVKAETKQEVNPVLNSLSSSEKVEGLNPDLKREGFNLNDNSDKRFFETPDEKDHKIGVNRKFAEIFNEKTSGETMKAANQQKMIKAIDLVKELSNLIQKQDKNSFVIKLDPAHLGKLKIALDMTESHKMKAHIEVDNEAARRVVESNIKELQTSLTKSGTSLESVNISLTQQDHENQKSQWSKKKNNSSDKFANEVGTEFVEEQEETISARNLGYNTVEYLA